MQLTNKNSFWRTWQPCISHTFPLRLAKWASYLKKQKKDYTVHLFLAGWWFQQSWYFPVLFVFSILSQPRTCWMFIRKDWNFKLSLLVWLLLLCVVLSQVKAWWWKHEVNWLKRQPEFIQSPDGCQPLFLRSRLVSFPWQWPRMEINYRMFTQSRPHNWVAGIAMSAGSVMNRVESYGSWKTR